ncbi:hypothetical protein A3770_09p54450 [Chloropicon primus]|uniref:Ankyrin repeat domain-containing protein n=1 Tax=Chloropicon primus TaxID=1764295 RepID=A0A5B8MRN2_9CHLO|nr:hypothetical protein A3770_09p54450 [Chloropicon primus]|eukprot:QDZ22927.1 hypothetical protein A3770_09p54450 [Chloropicon primus]
MEETMESKRQRREGRDALDVLPGVLWSVIGTHVADYDRVAFGLTCRTFLEAVTMATTATATAANPEQKKVALKTDLSQEKLFKEMPCFSMDWFQWVLRSFERRKGASAEEDDRCRGYDDPLYDSDLLHLAAFQGSKKVIKWLVSQGIPLEIKGWWSGAAATEAATGAAGGGHLELLEWLRSEGHGFNVWTCSYAARGGHLDVLKWLRSQDPPCPWNKRTCEYAARGGHLHVLQWARSQDPPCPWDEVTCWGAAEGAHLDVLQWARSQDPPCPWNKWTCRMAALGGHLEFCSGLEARTRLVFGTSGLVMRQLEEVTLTCCSGFEARTHLALGTGRLVLMQLEEVTLRFCSGLEARTHLWARSQDPPCDWDLWTCKWAARGGHLHVLQWLRSQDPPCPWNKATCDWAARGGHLDVLQWARSQDPPCDWGEMTCGWAAQGGWLDILMWLRSQDPPCPWDPEEIYDTADEEGHLHILQWLQLELRFEPSLSDVSSGRSSVEEDEDDDYTDDV